MPRSLSPDSKITWTQVLDLYKQGRPCTTALCYQSVNKRWAGALALSRPFHLQPVSIFKVQEQSFQTAASSFSDASSQLDALASWILRFYGFLMRRWELFTLCIRSSLETAILFRVKGLLELLAYHIFILFSKKVHQRAESQASQGTSGLKNQPLCPISLIRLLWWHQCCSEQHCK